MPFSAQLPELSGKMLYIDKISHIVLRRTASNWFMDGIRHAEWCVLICCIDGYAEYRFESSSLRVKPGDAIFFPQNVERSVRSDRDCPWSYCSIVFSICEDTGLSGRDLAGLFGGNPIAISNGIRSTFSELPLLWAEKSPGRELRCAGLVMDLIGRMIEESAERSLYASIPDYARIKRAALLLEKRRRDSDIGDVAAELGLSESRFRHVFKDATGYSPTRYANIRAVKKAAELLASGEYTVTEVAEELGFDNIFYFSRLFKSLTGQNPSTFLQK